MAEEPIDVDALLVQICEDYFVGEPGANLDYGERYMPDRAQAILQRYGLDLPDNTCGDTRCPEEHGDEDARPNPPRR